MNIEYAKQQMIAQQVRTGSVTDTAVLETLDGLARDQFVPEAYRHLAYADTCIPLANGQFMMTPLIEARMLQALRLEPQQQVLEIGTGSGFVTACLARLAASVTSIDIFPDFTSTAAVTLQEAGVNNAELTCMDATAELPRQQFDALAITASMPRLDERFVEALKPGGRLFVVIGDPPAMEAQLITRVDDGALQVQSLFETIVAPLHNVSPTPAFQF